MQTDKDNPDKSQAPEADNMASGPSFEPAPVLQGKAGLEDETGFDPFHSPIRPVPKRVRKLVVVIDNSPECRVALRFAAARASHITGGSLILFHCIRPGEFQHWVAVAERMREEAYEEAEQLLSDTAQEVFEYSGVHPEIKICEGQQAQTLFDFMQSDQDLFGLVLGVSTGGSPGPLVDYFTHERAGDLPCPVFLVPGNMTYEKIDLIA